MGRLDLRDRQKIMFTLSFRGGEADKNLIDFYDVSQALVGFERSLALTVHLALNSKVITHAPALKGAQILAYPAEPGSWKMTAVVLATGLYNLGTADRHTPIGHLVHSLYDYVVSESLGVHVDYEKSLGQLVEEHAKATGQKVLRQSQADSLIEKCEIAIREMHRPISKSQTADGARIKAVIEGKPIPIRTKLTYETYEYIHETRTSDEPVEFVGLVTSYNINTFKGRIYSKQYGRPIPFVLADTARGQRMIRMVASSLRASAMKDQLDRARLLRIKAFVNTSRSGQVKGFIVVSVDFANT